MIQTKNIFWFLMCLFCFVGTLYYSYKNIQELTNENLPIQVLVLFGALTFCLLISFSTAYYFLKEMILDYQAYKEYKNLRK